MILLTKWPAKMDVVQIRRSRRGMWMGWEPGWKRRAWMWVCSDVEKVKQNLSLWGFLIGQTCVHPPSGCVRRIQMFCASRRQSVQRSPSLLKSPQCQSTLTSTGLVQMTNKVTVVWLCSARTNPSKLRMASVSGFNFTSTLVCFVWTCTVGCVCIYTLFKTSCARLLPYFKSLCCPN